MRRFEHPFAYYTLRPWTEHADGAGERVLARDELELVALLRALAGDTPTWTLGPLLLELGHAIEHDTDALVWRIARLIMRGELLLEREPRIVLASDTIVKEAPVETERAVNEIDEGIGLYPGVRFEPRYALAQASVGTLPRLMGDARHEPPPTIEVGVELGPPRRLAVGVSVGSSSAA